MARDGLASLTGCSRASVSNCCKLASMTHQSWRFKTVMAPRSQFLLVITCVGTALAQFLQFGTLEIGYQSVRNSVAY